MNLQIHNFKDLFVCMFCWLVGCLVGWSFGRPFGWLVGCLVCHLGGWFVFWFVDWLVHQLVGWFVGQWFVC